jgi:predicted dithiol-disulfide oxidoreductase (DUF899 family)
MTSHSVGTREEWLEARKALLEQEKELTRSTSSTLLDRAPKGRGEDFEGWPRRHDEYEAAIAGG